MHVACYICFLPRHVCSLATDLLVLGHQNLLEAYGGAHRFLALQHYSYSIAAATYGAQPESWWWWAETKQSTNAIYNSS